MCFTLGLQVGHRSSFWCVSAVFFSFLFLSHLFRLFLRQFLLSSRTVSVRLMTAVSGSTSAVLENCLSSVSDGCFWVSFCCLGELSVQLVTAVSGSVSAVLENFQFS